MKQLFECGLIVLGLIAPVLSTLAADPETRDLLIQVDGKKAGEMHITVQQLENGSTAISSAADVAVDKLVIHYTYSYRGTELWKDGKLLQLDSNTNDNGKKLSVAAVADKDAIRLRADGKERLVRPDVWTTSYTRYPDVSRCDKTVNLIDADTGKEMTATMQYMGKDELIVAGNKIACTHFHLSGGVTVDLWYDGQGRLVRHESVQSGHKMLIELAGIRR
jgi:hypothetical protein